MKELQRLTGGYKRHIDYLLTLQSEVMGVQNSLFRALGHDLVLSGCAITDHGNGTVSIADGVVYVDGNIVRFQGAANVEPGKALLLNPVPVQTDPDDFFDGTTKNTYKELFAIVGNATSLATQIIVNPTELYNIKQYMHDIVQSYGQKGETKWVIDLDGSFITNFDSSGLGTTPKWMGWALMNGNNGTPTMVGRTPIGVGTFTDTYGLQHNFWHNRADGQPRHKLSIPEMPSHNHGYEGSGGASGGGDASRKSVPESKITGNRGGDTPHNNMQPYRAGYWVIKIE